MSKPITDKAEVSIDFPDKLYIGSFGGGSRYDVTADREGVHIHLSRADGEKRHVGFHLHYPLLAEILEAMGEAVDRVEAIEPWQRDKLRVAVERLREGIG